MVNLTFCELVKKLVGDNFWGVEGKARQDFCKMKKVFMVNTIKFSASFVGFLTIDNIRAIDRGGW